MVIKPEKRPVCKAKNKANLIRLGLFPGPDPSSGVFVISVERFATSVPSVDYYKSDLSENGAQKTASLNSQRILHKEPSFMLNGLAGVISWRAFFNKVLFVGRKRDQQALHSPRKRKRTEEQIQSLRSFTEF